MGSSWEGTTAEPDLSWMSFAPEAHGIKPALSVWPSRNVINNSSPDSYEQQHQQESFGNDDGGGNGHGNGRGRGRSKSLSSFDESEGREAEESVEEEREEEWLRRRSGRRRDWGKEQARKVFEDFDDNGDYDPSLGDDGEPLSASSLSVGIRRPYSSLGRRSPTRWQRERQQQQQQKSWMQSLDENTATAQPPWSSKFPNLQFAVTVAFFGFLVALAISTFLLYLSFGATARPPSSCEIDNVVLNFTARRIRLRGGRYISFREQGVGADRAQHTLLVVHDLVSSRLAGIPGISESLLEELGVRLIAYDRPGYGQSDPHPGRSYNSSAQDMVDIADALGVGEKFWVAGFGTGGPHVWAAINYIPERLAGVALFAPAGNFYAEYMTKDEVAETWGLLTLRQKWMYIIARLFPALLPSLLQKTLVDHNPGPLRTMGGPPVGSKDQVLMEREEILDFWKRDVKEALQQQCAFPMAEELILLVNNWGFSLAKLPFNEREVKTLLQQVVGLFQAKEKPRIFSGPIHIWQGTDDQHVTATISEYAKRMILRNDFPKITDSPVYLHALEGEGHFSWFWFCDDCHRTIFNSLFRPEEVVSGPYGRQAFSPEYEKAILAAFGGHKEGVDKLVKNDEAPVTFTRNAEEATDDLLYRNVAKNEEGPVTSMRNDQEATDDLSYRNAALEEEISTGLKLYVPESCAVPIDLPTFIIRAIDERIRKYIR